MYPRFIPNYSFSLLISAAVSCLQESSLQEKFEKKFAKKTGRKYAVFFPYGRTGLIALLNALEIKNKKIITPAYTCVVVPHAVKYSKNEPLFVDSTLEDYNMNLDSIEKLIESDVAAIIATSIFGHPVNLDKLDQIQKNHPHLKIIQDCAHSFSASWKGKNVDTYGVAAFYGMNISKIMNSVFGGMVVLDNEELYKKLLVERSKMLLPAPASKGIKSVLYSFAAWIAFKPMVFGFVNFLKKNGFLNRFVKYYDDSTIDMPADYLISPTPYQSAVGIRQLEIYDDLIKTRRECAQIYFKELQNRDDFQLPLNESGATYSHFVVRTPKKKELIAFFNEHGVELGELIEYSIPMMKAYYQVQKSDSFITNSWPQLTINLPIHSTKLAHRVIEIMKMYFQQQKGNY